jgi:hypothetical protein
LGDLDSTVWLRGRFSKFGRIGSGESKKRERADNARACDRRKREAAARPIGRPLQAWVFGRRIEHETSIYIEGNANRRSVAVKIELVIVRYKLR